MDSKIKEDDKIANNIHLRAGSDKFDHEEMPVLSD